VPRAGAADGAPACGDAAGGGGACVCASGHTANVTNNTADMPTTMRFIVHSLIAKDANADRLRHIVAQNVPPVQREASPVTARPD